MTTDGELVRRVVVAIFLAVAIVHVLDDAADRVIDWRRRGRERGP